MEWMSALRQDEAWILQEERLLSYGSSGEAAFRTKAVERMGDDTVSDYWEIYNHNVEKTIQEAWDTGMSLVKLKIQAIGLLTLEWLEQHAEPVEIEKSVKKKKAPANAPQKPRETMTFKRKSGVLEGHLSLLFDKLVKADWIEGEEANFKALFSGRLYDDCQLTWMGKYGKGTLVELFKQMVVTTLIVVPDGFTLPAILEGHFKDVKGNWLTGLDKGNGACAKALPFIYECVKLLKITPNGGYQEDEDFMSIYDPFDHQDIKLHKR